MAVRSLFVATAASFFMLAKANDYPPLPPCTVPFVPFDYVGCFEDTANPRALAFAPNLDFYTLTQEECISSCKGKEIW